MRIARIVIAAMSLTLIPDVGVCAGQNPPSAPLTMAQVTAEIGSDAHVRAVLSLVLTHAFANGSKREFFLASQVQDEWLPALDRVQLVRLADAEIPSHLAACGRYWFIGQLTREGDVVSMELHQRCGAGTKYYITSFDGRRWRLGPPGTGDDGGGWGPGGGSGFLGRPPGCPCIR